MGRGGFRDGAGRPKGTGKKEVVAKIVKERQQQIASGDESKEQKIVKRKTPLEHMLDVMNDENSDDMRRDRMAIAAAPFVHSKAGEKGIKETRQEEAKKVSGKYTSPPPPPIHKAH